MLKRVHSRIWFYDIEWVPDPVSARRLFDLPSELSDRKAMEYLWSAAGATEDFPMPFVKLALSRVVSIAFLSRNIIIADGEKRVEFGIHTLPSTLDSTPEGLESNIIEKFLRYVGEREPQLVGFNSESSDLKILIQRGIANEVVAEKFSHRPDKPWEGRDYFSDFSLWHIDLLKLLSGRGRDNPSLNEIAAACGIPGKIETSGDQVSTLWLDGDLEKIIAYNELDTLTTYLVWLRLARFSGQIKDHAYETEIRMFHEFLEAESTQKSKPHFADFLDRWQKQQSVG